MKWLIQLRLRLMMLFCITLALASCLQKKSIADNHTIIPNQLEMIAAVVKEYCDANLFFGTIYITSVDKVIYQHHCGPQNMQYDVANSVKSKYRIGSNTKAFSAAILMNMLDGKDLRQETIGDHLPWYPDNQCADVSLHHLLTMSSGINNYSDNEAVYDNYGWRPYLYDSNLDLNGPEDFSNRFCTCGAEAGQSGTPSFTPGSKYEYSNCNYYLIGNIIEQLAAGKQGNIGREYWFANIVQEQILNPLNMTDSGSYSAIGVYSNMTTGYIYNQNQYLPLANGRPPATGGPAPYEDILVNPYSNPLVLYSAGDLYSTVEDMHKWDQGLYGTQILSDAQKLAAFAPYSNTGSSTECEYYGYGWFVTYVDPNQYGKVANCPENPADANLRMYEKFLQYSGSYPYSWVTSFTRLLERDQSIMVFSNYVKEGIESDCIADEIRNIIFYSDKHRTEECQQDLNQA
ncbi:beta-lactamase family protein [Pseudoalteromonas sp. SCSIO 43201]|uniref:serine hydrolase domain-containing protein n=1 Tax=Pseudoalteromonas sp. SCSIO 43201 TaxID=2822842 RepID=UPI0020761719|nr:serine hydrolase domain-containing protein [Pseudoalteromonas sp. SCSIO 43201]USD28985.1 beta-lactamase family protein [Pseudoalteromonas sp. SCSIO 43201]